MENENSIVYNAIVLTDDSVKLLKEWFPPIHQNEYYHHMTINFGVKKFPDNLGEIVSFRVIGENHDDKGQAVVVDSESDNPIPHITLSCADGVKPVYSNKLLENGYDKVRSTKLILKGTVKSYTKDGWI